VLQICSGFRTLDPWIQVWLSLSSAGVYLDAL
jgi:hypothetical protein